MFVKKMASQTKDMPNLIDSKPTQAIRSCYLNIQIEMPSEMNDLAYFIYYSDITFQMERTAVV